MDTLKAARTLEAKGFTREQAEGIAEVIADTGLAALKRDVDVLKWMVGAMIVIMVAVFWQLFTLNGTVTRLDERMASLTDRMTKVENRLTTLEAGQAAIRDQLAAIQAAPGSKP